MAWIPNVNPNELITSSWGNQIRDRTVHTFVNTAERTAAIPTPTAGMVTYLTGTDSLEYWHGTAWVRVGPGQLAYKFTAAQQTGVATSAVDITSLTSTLTVPAGRRIQLSASVGFFKGGADQTGYCTVQITDGVNTLIMDRNQNIAINTYASAYVVTRLEPTAGTYTWKARAVTNIGFVNITPGSLLMVEDVGPQSMAD